MSNKVTINVLSLWSLRYMNSNGTARKIDAPKYIEWTKTLQK